MSSRSIRLGLPPSPCPPVGGGGALLSCPSRRVGLPLFLCSVSLAYGTRIKILGNEDRHPSVPRPTITSHVTLRSQLCNRSKVAFGLTATRQATCLTGTENNGLERGKAVRVLHENGSPWLRNWTVSSRDPFCAEECLDLLQNLNIFLFTRQQSPTTESLL
jgi:hypothetical protein